MVEASAEQVAPLERQRQVAIVGTAGPVVVADEVAPVLLVAAIEVVAPAVVAVVDAAAPVVAIQPRCLLEPESFAVVGCTLEFVAQRQHVVKERSSHVAEHSSIGKHWHRSEMAQRR